MASCVMSKHHFHIAPYILLSDPPKEVYICCYCGDRREVLHFVQKKVPIPESCGKFHPEKPGHCFTMMEKKEK